MSVVRWFRAREHDFTGKPSQGAAPWAWDKSILTAAQRAPLQELYETTPIAGCCVDFVLHEGLAYPDTGQTENSDACGCERGFSFLFPTQIGEEFLENNVARYGLQLGFVPIGCCSVGSGDLYCLRCDPDEQLYANQLWLLSSEGSSPFDNLWFDAHCFVATLAQIVNALTIIK